MLIVIRSVRWVDGFKNWQSKVVQYSVLKTGN
jgi:hypothetical protein